MKLSENVGMPSSMPCPSSIRCGALASDDSTTVKGTPEALILAASVGSSMEWL